MLNLIQTYAKEIVSLLVPFITWLLNSFLKGKARLQVAQPHTFTFIVQQPLIGSNGNQISPTQTVHTNSLIVRNAGREHATKVELVFNWKPMCINVWPPRHFQEHLEPDQRYVLIFESLSPGEVLGCEVLSINGEVPSLVTVRSDQSVAQFINMHPQPVVSNAVRTATTVFLSLGLATAVYASILLVQFLVLKTPYGH